MITSVYCLQVHLPSPSVLTGPTYSHAASYTMEHNSRIRCYGDISSTHYMIVQLSPTSSPSPSPCRSRFLLIFIFAPIPAFLKDAGIFRNGVLPTILFALTHLDFFSTNLSCTHSRTSPTTVNSTPTSRQRKAQSIKLLQWFAHHVCSRAPVLDSQCGNIDIDMFD
jgi:hypothetical protein